MNWDAAADAAAADAAVQGGQYTPLEMHSEVDVEESG